MIICPTIQPRSVSEARAQLSALSARKEPVEVRIDAIREPDLASMLAGRRPPVIITNRRALEGGSFRGNAVQQRAILTDAILSGAEFVDIEFSWGLELIHHVRSLGKRTRLIVSYHNHQRTPARIMELYRRMRLTRADIIKIATYAERIEDTGHIFSILETARSDRQPAIALCMGEHGEITRIIGGKFGALLSYAPPEGSDPTANGQIGIGPLERIYRAGSITRRTHVFGLVGNPVSYSRGYLYHNDLFRRRKANAVYINFLVEDLRSFLETCSGFISGVSITMPFKKEIIQYLDHVDEVSRMVSSVNTVIRKRGRTYGSNTDFGAVVNAIKRHTAFSRKSVVVLGTGGTSRTMACAAVSNGARTTIVGRSRQKAQSIAIEFGCDVASIGDLPALKADILMNGTSVGMTGNPVRSIVPRTMLRRGMIVLDAVYSPEITPLLLEARKAGATLVTGRELFERQAELQSREFLTLLQ